MVAALELEIPWGQQKPPYGTKLNAKHPLVKRGVSLILPFNEGAGKTVWDARGNGLTGTLNGGVTWAPSLAGVAPKFDGSLGEVSCGHGSQFDATNAVSASAWVSLSATPIASQGAGVISKGVATDGNSAAYEILVLSDLSLFVRIFTSVSVSATSASGLVPLGQRVFLSLVYDRVSLRGYVNGNLVCSTAETRAIQTNSGNLTLGVRFVHSGLSGFSHLKGTIDNVAAGNNAPTPQQVADLYANPWGMFAPRTLRMAGRASGGLLLRRRRAAA